MSEQLFLEDFSYIERYDVLNEGKEGGKYLLRGVFSRVDHPNKNKRIYLYDTVKFYPNYRRTALLLPQSPVCEIHRP